MSPDPKILFLDIDGVLNRWPPQPGDMPSTPHYGWQNFGFIPKAAARVRSIVFPTVRIVFSSSWRFEVPPEDVAQALDLAPFFMLGCTRALPHAGRGAEICDWLRRHPHGNFVILDDDVHDMTQPELQGHIVETDGAEGLTQMDTEKALSILFPGIKHHVL